MNHEKDWAQRLLKLMGSRRYRPMSADELAAELGVEDREAFLAEINRMRIEGDVVRIKFKRYVLPEKAGLLVGILRCNRGGFGFLTPTRGYSGPDLYVGQEAMGVALDGDTVVARVQRPPEGRRGRARHASRGPEAQIIEVLKRSRSEIVGTFRKSPHFYYVVPDDPAFLRDIYVDRAESENVREGDRVVVALDPWTDPHLNPEGKVVEVLGSAQDAGIDLDAIIRLFAIPVDFPPEAVRDAEEAAAEPIERAAPGRLDLTAELVCTIDPEDAKDFDDAVSIRRTRDGYALGVHIADVSHYVRPGTALDEAASQRGTSVYFPGTAIPMLPHALSSNICSLRQGEVRLTKSVFTNFSAEGEPLEFDIRPSMIRSACRLSYEEAWQALQGHPPTRVPGDVVHMLLDMRRLAELLNRRRMANGALDLDIPEIALSLNPDGTVREIRQAERNFAHRLIEEFMVAANETVAHFLSRHKLPYLSRIHPDPSPDDLEEMRQLALSLGYSVGDPRKVRNIQRLLEQADGREDGWLVNIAVLRSLRQAEYSAWPDKHFALALKHYTHFTSPIRRYPDLLVHRILDEQFANRVHGTEAREAWQQRLEVAGPHCTFTERRAEDAERLFIKRKILRFLEDHSGETFGARVAGMHPRGMVVRLDRYLIEGTVPFSTMSDDFYRADRSRTAVFGRRTGKRYRIGSPVKVTLQEVDHQSYEVYFALVR